MIFNGIEKDYIVPLTGRRRSAWAPISRNLITVTGMPGAHLSHTDVQARVITVPVLVKAENISELQKTKEDMAEWLIHDEPKELIFKDEPDRVYYAVVDGELELDEIFSTGRGEITFICPDPYKYGPEKVVEPSSDTFIVENNGTAEAEPIITLTAKEPTTFAMVSNGEEYMMVGRTVDVDDIPTEKYPRMLQENGSSLTGWSHMTAGYVISDSMFSGIAGGSMGTTGYSFVAESFGSNPNGWTGPMIRRSFSEPLQDFKATVDIAMFNRGTGVGKVVVFFLDENDDIVASMGIYDATNDYPNNKVAFRLGGSKTIVDTPGDNYGVYNNSRVWLELTREGQRFKAFSYLKRDDGTLHARNTQLFNDTRNEFQTPIRQVMIYIAKAKDYNPFEMHMHGLSVFGINDLSDNQVPYIADAGDKIVFDHQTGDCYINGEPVPFDFGADFFTLKKGVNTLTVMPENTFNTKITYRERYK